MSLFEEEDSASRGWLGSTAGASEGQSHREQPRVSGYGNHGADGEVRPAE